MKKRVSLKDIAKEVGVSTALVSYVMNGKEKEARVGKDIAQKIREAALELNYQTNQIAKSLKMGRSQILGLVVADIANPFFGSIARTIEDEAAKHNYTVIFGSSDENNEKSANLIQVFLKQQVDGLIIAPTDNSESQIQQLEDQHIPYVLIDRFFPAINSNYVISDNYDAAYNAIKYLMVEGKSRVAMVAYKSDLSHMKDRKRGYSDAIKELSKGQQQPIIKEVAGHKGRIEVDQAMRQLLTDHPDVDAIFFATNTLSINGLIYMKRSNIRIPADIDVVCFDESEAYEFFNEPLTVVEQALDQIGIEAVRVLTDQIQNGGAGQQQITVRSRLKNRRDATIS